MIPESNYKQTLERGKEGRDEIILDNMEMANRLIRKYAARYPNRHDDIQGAALHGLVYAVQRIADGHLETEFYRTYIYAVMREHIVREIMHDHLIPIPKYKYIEIVEDNRKQLPIIYRVHRDDDEENPQESNELMFDIEAKDERISLVISEFYAGLTEKERLAVDMKVEGFTLQEIAPAIGYKSNERVLFVLREVARKLKREIENAGGKVTGYDGEAQAGKSETSESTGPSKLGLRDGTHDTGPDDGSSK